MGISHLAGMRRINSRFSSSEQGHGFQNAYVSEEAVQAWREGWGSWPYAEHVHPGPFFFPLLFFFFPFSLSQLVGQNEVSSGSIHIISAALFAQRGTMVFSTRPGSI